MTELPEASAFSSQSGARLTRVELDQRLSEFESYLTREALASSARGTYVDQAGRFVRWLAGEYRPRNAASPSTREVAPRANSWTVPELRDELVAYRVELEDARLRPMAIRTYVGRSETFVRWLDGGYTTRRPNAATRGPRALTSTVDDSWLDESKIQAHVVQWLESEGWRVIRQASGREHGTDIDAERAGVRLAVEVKGHPRRLHVFGANKGQARKWHPAAQVRTYYGNALHTAISMLHADPTRQVAIALPDLPAYRGLVARSRDPLGRLGIHVWFVAEAGGVRDG